MYWSGHFDPFLDCKKISPNRRMSNESSKELNNSKKNSFDFVNKINEIRVKLFYM